MAFSLRSGFNKACMRGTSLMSSMSKGMASQASVMPKAVYSGESAGNDGYRIVGSTVVMRLNVIQRAEEPFFTKHGEFTDKFRSSAWIQPGSDLTGEQRDREKNLYDEEMKKCADYIPNPRLTEEDFTDDRRSLNRRMADNLYLIVKKNRSEHVWQFPQGEWIKGESIRDTVERSMESKLGKSIGIHFLGNMPMSHMQYDFADDSTHPAAKKYNGTKTYFMHGIHMCNQVDLSSEYTDHRWVAHDELHEYLEPELMNVCEDMLLDFGTGYHETKFLNGGLSPY